MKTPFELAQRETFEVQREQLDAYMKNGGHRLGPWTTNLLISDPRHLAFSLSRYKFVSKLFEAKNHILEIGCGDSFGSLVVAANKTAYIGLDIEPEIIQDNLKRLPMGNLNFFCHDILEGPISTNADAVFSLDVIEHIPPSMSGEFIKNMKMSTKNAGLILIGTPNVHAAMYASPGAKKSHINLHSHESLKELLLKEYKEVLTFSMNDEVVHTGYTKMAHYIFALGITPIENKN